MTTPVWALLGFAAWTLFLLLATDGVYRWSLILTGRVPIRNFRADQIEGSDWYRRAMRAHANCIENLPVFGPIVFALYVGNVSGDLVNKLAVVVLITRSRSRSCTSGSSRATPWRRSVSRSSSCRSSLSSC